MIRRPTKNKKTPAEDIRDRAVRGAHQLRRLLSMANAARRLLERHGTSKDSFPAGKVRTSHQIILTGIADSALALRRYLDRYETWERQPRRSSIMDAFDRPGRPISFRRVSASSAVRLVFKLIERVIDPVKVTTVTTAQQCGLMLVRKRQEAPATPGWLDKLTDTEYAAIVEQVRLIARNPPLTENELGRLVEGVRSDYASVKTRAIAKGQGCPLEIATDGNLVIRGKPYAIKLSPPAMNVLKALRAQWPEGLTKDKLVEKSGSNDAVRVLHRLARRYKVIADVIDLPGAPGRRGYAIKEE